MHRAVKEGIIFDEQILYSFVDVGIDVGFFVDISALDIDVIQILQAFIVFFLDRLEQRHDDPHFEVLSVESFRKRVYDIGQSAGLHKRK